MDGFAMNGWDSWNSYKVRRPVQASVVGGVLVGAWAFALTSDVRAVLAAFVFTLLLLYFCYRPGGPQRNRLLVKYHEDGTLRDASNDS